VEHAHPHIYTCVCLYVSDFLMAILVSRYGDDVFAGQYAPGTLTRGGEGEGRSTRLRVGYQDDKKEEEFGLWAKATYIIYIYVYVVCRRVM